MKKKKNPKNRPSLRKKKNITKQLKLNSVTKGGLTPKRNVCVYTKQREGKPK